jgi:hypothetical protein
VTDARGPRTDWQATLLLRGEAVATFAPGRRATSGASPNVPAGAYEVEIEFAGGARRRVPVRVEVLAEAAVRVEL